MSQTLLLKPRRAGAPPKPSRQDKVIVIGDAETDEMRLYLSQIRSIPRLAETEEAQLAQTIAQGRSERERARRLRISPDPAVLALGEQAQRSLVEANLRLVVSLAKNYIGQGVSLLDLIQEGNIGLVLAAERFDRSKGKFSTYASWWIFQGLQRALENRTITCRIPSYAHTELRKIRREQSRLFQETGREPGYAQLALGTGIAELRVEELLRASATTVSLDKPLYETDEETALRDVLTDSASSSVEEAALHDALQDPLERLITDVLTKRECAVLRLRYGLGGEASHSLDRTGKALGISGERVRQLEAKALSKLRHSPQARQLYFSL